MQLTTPKGKFIEKIIRDKNGKLVRASFCVYECNGRARAHLLNAEYINENRKIDNGKILLDFTTHSIEKYELVFSKNKIASPYFNSNLLYSSGSKPRAPTK